MAAGIDTRSWSLEDVVWMIEMVRGPSVWRFAGQMVLGIDQRIRISTLSVGICVVLLLGMIPTYAQNDIEEPSLRLEIGPAAEWPLHGERASFGGNVAIEKEVIEGWLELELGLTGRGMAGRGELSEDLLFKKPFRLSPDFEFLIGVGPEITQTLNGPDKGTSAGVEFAVELMFLPRTVVGWYVEPAFGIAPATGQKSFGLTGGLVIGF
jgi:hypothetical protein